MAGKDSAPTQLSPYFWNCPKRVELESSYSGCMDVNIDKANSRRYVTRYGMMNDEGDDDKSGDLTQTN